MLVGMKKRFVPFVLEGSKTHTIRAMRKRPFRVGDTCDVYSDPRQRSMKLLGRWPCVKVEEIRAYAVQAVSAGVGFTEAVVIEIDGQQLSNDEKNALAWRDGFRSFGPDKAFAEMVAYWKDDLPFEGQIVHWRFYPAQQEAV